MYDNDLNKDGKISMWEYFPYWFDKLRIFPRAFISMYIYLLWRVVEWFMALPDPTNAQAGLVSVVVGAGAAWFGLYVNSGAAAKVEVPSQTISQPQLYIQATPTKPTTYSEYNYGEYDYKSQPPAVKPEDNRG